MTNEQIKQNAEEYANHKLDWSRKRHSESPYLAWEEGFEDGAHSRDEEIKELNGQVTLHKERADYYHDLYMKLRNPWFSVKDRLPENDTLCAIRLADDEIAIARYFNCGFIINRTKPITHWMLIPELKGGKL